MRDRVSRWKRAASERTCNERESREDSVTRLGGEYGPLGDALIGTLTRTMFPCSSLNGGPPFVPK